MIKIYAAGPIEECIIEQATEWRQQLDMDFAEEIKDGDILILDPMHGKHDIVGPGEIISPETYQSKSKNVAVSAQAVFQRDIAMIDSCDIILANFAHLNTASKGTMFELGYGYALEKMMIVVSTQPSITEHPFIKIPCIQYPAIDDAIAFIKTLASAGLGR